MDSTKEYCRPFEQAVELQSRWGANYFERHEKPQLKKKCLVK
ncbi:hypothetical protein [Dendronalium sp. ChiSLP03b]|nr:hypothetical protein [Dendronalium sp. ChiSLP03b]